MSPYIWIMFGTTFFSAFSQILLKQSAEKTYKSFIYEYVNWRVVTAYIIYFIVLFVNTYAYTRVDMKYGSVIDTFSYVMVLALSFVILRERFTKKQLLGNLLIAIGIFIYTL